MNGYSTQSLAPEKLLTVAANLLHKAFIDSSRAEAKRVFREIAAGKSVAVAKLAMEDGSELTVHISLDSSEMRGTPSFSRFRDIVLAMLIRIAKQIEEAQDLHLFREQESSQMLFNLPGFEFSEVDGQATLVNVVVLGIKQVQAGEITLNLMYLEPGQFEFAIRRDAVPGA